MHTQLYPPLPSTSVTLGSSFSAHADTLALFPTPKDSKTTLPKSVQPIYFAQYDHAQLERRELLVETYTLFDSLQVRTPEQSSQGTKRRADKFVS